MTALRAFLTSPRIYLVTNDAARCALELWCHPGNLPPSVAVVDNPDQMLRIPSGVSVRCYWYGPRDAIAAWESWWTHRRLKGGFKWVSQEDWARIEDWAWERRRRPDMLLLQGVDVGPSPWASTTSSVAVRHCIEPETPDASDAPQMPSASAIEQSASKRTSKWI